MRQISRIGERRRKTTSAPGVAGMHLSTVILPIHRWSEGWKIWRRAAGVWRRVQPAFLGKVVGPPFEKMCREWSRWYAAPETHGGYASRVASGTVFDSAARTSHEVDIAVFGHDSGNRDTLQAIGEAEWGETLGIGHLQCLEHIRALVRARGVVRADDTRLLCFSGVGFTGELHRRASQDQTVQLVDLGRLYHGA